MWTPPRTNNSDGQGGRHEAARAMEESCDEASSRNTLSRQLARSKHFLDKQAFGLLPDARLRLGPGNAAAFFFETLGKRKFPEARAEIFIGWRHTPQVGR